MKKRRQILFQLFVLTGFLASCGGSNSPSPVAAVTSVSGASGSNTTLTFALSLTLNSDNDNHDVVLNIPGPHSLPVLHDAANGSITLAARDFPRLVYRVCHLASTQNCQGYTDMLGFDVDIVIDACGRFLDNALCGENDFTEYVGVWDEVGNILVEDVAMRTRLFIVSDDEDGYTTSDQADGLVDFNRTVVTLTTGIGQIGEMAAEGSPVDADGNVTLIATGSVTNNPITVGNATLSDTEFLGIITGRFDGSSMLQ